MSDILKRLAGRFRDDDRGNIALIFGLTLVPLMGLVGVGVDYSRGSQLKARMSVGADAAVLAAVKASGKTLAERQALADAAFRSNVGSDPNLTSLTGTLIKLSGNGYRFEATANYRYVLAQVLPGGQTSSSLSVAAEATSGEGRVEVALVLDNTGSMANDMTALRKAATDFTNTLFDYAGGSSDLKMSVVPYVAAVNPGRLNLGMSSVDTRGDSDHQAANLRWRWIGFLPNCNNDPFWVPGPGGGGGGNNNGPGTPGSGAWLQDALRKFGGAGQELFGIKSATAQVGTYGTPNRAAPFTGTAFRVDPPYTQSTITGIIPNGFNHDPQWSRCVLANPAKIANLDLFDGIRLKNGTRAQWKGCVEARPAPFDVTDAPPNASDPRTLFTPYFWPDEPGNGPQGNSMGYVNNYMDDGDVPAPFTRGWEWEWQANLFKYDGTDRNANFDEQPPITSGPNMACPDELLRLTSNRQTVLNKIAGMRHWNGGGTISSEGIMWGWRTLSPNAPFADGVAYNTVGTKKVLVLMTDGENQVGGNNVNGPVMSHYNAYGYMRWGRFGAENFQTAKTFLNNRMATACTNAKNAGIQVITILFREDSNQIKQLMENCATTNRLFYIARDQNELQRAFAEVAEQIGKIRLTK